MQTKTLTKDEIREILKRPENRGAIQEIATDLRIKIPSISGWFSGKHASARVAKACHTKALALLKRRRERVSR